MNNIKEARTMSDMKQADLCVRLGVTQATLSCWETGKYEPSAKDWVKLSNILNVSIDYLMGKETVPALQNPEVVKKLYPEFLDMYASLSEEDQSDVIEYMKFRKMSSKRRNKL